MFFPKRRKKKALGYIVVSRQVLNTIEYTIDEIKVINCYSLTGQSAVQSSCVDGGVHILQQQKKKKNNSSIYPRNQNFFFDNNQTRLFSYL